MLRKVQHCARVPGSPRLALALFVLTALFAMRVAGQAVQAAFPQPWLPPFAAFQGSRLPYAILLSTQVVILILMVRASLRVARGMLWRSVHARALLLWLGGTYLAASLLRIAVGLAIPNAHPWFSTWIPAVFHVVLASWVLLLGIAYRSGQQVRSGA